MAVQREFFAYGRNGVGFPRRRHAANHLMAMTEAPFWEPTAGRGSSGILILSYLVLSCLILSYLVLSCLILSYLVFASDAAVIVWLCVARRRLDVGGDRGRNSSPERMSRPDQRPDSSAVR